MPLSTPRLLVLTANHPTAAGADQHRINCLADALKELGVMVEMRRCAIPNGVLRGDVARHFQTLWEQVPWTRFDFVHVYNPIHVWMYSLRPSRRGAKLIYDCQGLIHAEVALRDLRGIDRMRVPVLRFIEETAAKRADLCITVSTPLREVLEGWRGPSGGIGLIRNGVDPTAFAPGMRSDDGVFRVGYAGGFQAWQAVDLISSTARLCAHRTDIRWRIIGFEPQQQDLKARFRELLPEGSELIDRCERAELRRLLLECDLLVIPRRDSLACRVALPTKFAEYLSLAKPVLVNTVDETSALVLANKCGFAAAPNSHAMSQAIQLASEVGREELRAMGQAGRDFVLRHLAWPVIAREYKAFLEEHL